jgi:hypothetical protein
MRLSDTHLRLTGAVMADVEGEPAAVAGEADGLLLAGADDMPDVVAALLGGSTLGGTVTAVGDDELHAASMPTASGSVIIAVT